ncbi:MAG TPA: transglutaminase domain-containing protein [Blastocatellia bacterium]|nr:transglutaminase domain-containing protein [Blastocatellia bacterium]
MPRAFVRLLIVILIQLAAGSIASAQTADPKTRDAEWKSYKLPEAEFSRFLGVTKIVTFRAPASWEQSAGFLQFKGPHESELRLIVEKVADGIPLKSYTNAVLHNLRDIPGGSDSLTIRPTEISGLEAREFFFTIPDLRGDTTRRMIWCTVSGPNAVSFLFICPEANAAELEPYFKAVVESAVIFESDAECDLFDRLRGAAIKEAKPVRIDQVRNMAEQIAGFNDASRAKAVEELVSIFNSTPDAAVDLLIDRNPLVRAAAIEALGRSSNRGLDGFLVRALADQSAAVAVRAARSLAGRSDIVKLLRDDSAGWEGLQKNRVMRVAPFLNEQARKQLVDDLLQHKSNFNPPPPRKRPLLPPPPPPPARAQAQSPRSKNETTPKAPADSGPKLKSLGVMNVTGASRSYSDRIQTVLELLPDLDALAPILPAARLLEDEGDAERTLELALESRTRLPVDSLISLLKSDDQDLIRLAAMNLAVSGTGRDIARIEEAASKAATVSSEGTRRKAVEGTKGKEVEWTRVKEVAETRSKTARPLAEELRVTIKKIRWRESLETADPASREARFKEAFADAELAAWAWPYVRDYIEAPGPKLSKPLRGKTASGDVERKMTGTVAPLAENLLPANVTLYAAIPDAGDFIGRLGESLSSIQLDSARAQAKLLLVFKAFENQFGKIFGVRGGGSLLQSSGVKPHSAAVFARWTADGAPPGLSTAQRKAVVFRVQDRDRFEQLIATYHEFGSFKMLPEIVSAGARFLSAFPAVLPLAASMMSTPAAVKTENAVLSSQTLIAYDNCEGYPVTVFERREKLLMGGVNRDTIYMAYVGDAAILAWDWFALRDCIVRMSGKSETLASNASFKQAAAGGGDVIYLSEPLVLMSSTARKAKMPKLVERGALRISKAGWESSFDLSFGATGWQKLFTFKPAALKAPAVLLPRSSIAYLLMSFDFAAGWRMFSSDFLGAEAAKQFTTLWSLDFDREVLPELGPESGAVLLGMPATDKEGKIDAPWALFIQTKSDKLGKALAEGKLIKDTTAGKSSVRVKVGASNYWVAAKKGFLVFANSEAAIAALDSSEHLSVAREFEKALKGAPPEVVAFGGVSVDAATAGVAPGKDAAAAEGVEVFLSLARAFHSLNLHAAPSDSGLTARMSVSLDREGRYSVSDLAAVAKEFQFAAAEIEARGVPIVDQRRVDSLAIKITSKAPGALQRIRQDVTSGTQTAEERPDGSIVLTVKPRRATLASKVELPVTKPELAEFLKPAGLREDPTVTAQAQEIAGKDRDAWSVAGKLGDWTFKNLKWKRVDGASAGSTLATREADCLEFSQLFVAMARTVGLPARIVSGLAHTGSSFGGHAWVEVWAGEWVELDPTWGTNFVDATHVRSTSSELLAYAALNVINIEVLEARRDIAAFQKDPKSLVEAVCEELNGQRTEALSVAVDPAVLIDSLMGEGAWTGMSPAERDQIYSSHHRLIAELNDLFSNTWNYGAGARLLKLNQQRDGAEAIVLLPGTLMRLDLVRKGEAWFVREMKHGDLDFNAIAEGLRPSLLVLQAKRKGVPPPKLLESPQSRIMQARQQDLKLALQVADRALLENPGSTMLRYLRGLALLETAEENNTAQIDEAIKILTALADEQTNYALAIQDLGNHYASTDEDDPDFKNKQEKAIGFLRRYALLVPEDPRPHRTLAEIYDAREDPAAAEASYRKALELDPLDPDKYASLASFLVKQKRYKEALAVVDQTQGRGSSKDDTFADLFFTMYGEPGSAEIAEGLAAVSFDRILNSFKANVNLATVRINNGNAREALTLLKRAIELDPKSAWPHTLTAQAHRKLHNWVAALKSANDSLTIDAKDADAHFHRACALAQLRRPTEAIAALKKSVELDDESHSADDIENEGDLKPLAVLPAFKKLVAEIKRSEEAPAEPQKKDPNKEN